MPILTTPGELLAALGKSAFAADPMADLFQRGYTLSPDLKREVEAGLAHRKLKPPPAGVTAAHLKGGLNFRVAPPPLVPAAPPANGYDVIAGLTYSLANDALMAIYESGTIPHELALDQLLPATDLIALGGAFVVNVAGGQITRLKITAGPTVQATTEGSAIVAVLIPIEIDWTKTTTLATGTAVSKTVTEAIGTLQLTASLVANVVSRPETSSSTMAISVQLDNEVTSPADSPRLTLAATSPVQRVSPAPPDKIDGLAVIIQNALQQQLGASLSFPVSPHFSLPIGALEIRHVDVVAIGGALVAGLQVVGTQGPANPAALTNLLTDAMTNLFVQVHEIVINLALQTQLRNGTLTAQAQAQYDNAVVDSVSASFGSNSIEAQVKGRLVNECPFNVDLVFIDTRTVTFKFSGDTVEIDQKDDQSIADSHNWWCLLTTLGLVGLAVLGGALLGGLGGAIGFGLLGFLFTNVGPIAVEKGGAWVVGLFSGGGGPNETIVDLDSPIPGSDQLPTLTGGTFQVAGGVMLVTATAALRPDDVNAILYVRFQEHEGITVFGAKPLAGATVYLMDQDAPAPPGDDASTVVPNSYSTLHQKTGIQVINTFEAPKGDQKMAEGKTDLNGVVRFALLKSQLASTAGNIVTKMTRYDPDALRDVTTTSKKPVPEAKPDLYFRLIMTDGTVVDTRSMANGFMKNFTPARIGTLTNPLIFTIGGPATTGGLAH